MLRPGITPDPSVQRTLHSRLLRGFGLVLGISLAGSALVFFFSTWRWPLVGDASLLHYMSFLIGRGWAPYRQFSDMDMPGSFLVETAAMRLIGAGPLAWRLFDFSLALAAAAAIFVLCRRPDLGRPDLGRPNLGGPDLGRPDQRLAVLFASSLFVLIHGRDGLAQAGQRDLTIAVCQLLSTAFLFHGVRSAAARAWPVALWPAIAFGLFSGLAVTIKPFTLPLTLVQLALAAAALGGHLRMVPPDRVQPRPRTDCLRLVVAAALGYLFAPLAALLFLLHEQALPAFLAGLRTVVPYYASLGHRTLSYSLVHALSPVLALALVWLAVLALGGQQARIWDWERLALLAGVLSGLGCCVLQRRALPYYRYPLLAFLLPLLALDLVCALRIAYPPETHAGRPGTPRAAALAGLLALAGLAYGGLVLAPQSAIRIHRYRWYQTDMLDALERDLSALGGPALSGHVQCIDWISGCNTVLYRMRLESATGTLNDFLLFGASQVPAVQDERARLRQTLLVRPPAVLVVTSYLHLAAPADRDGFHKLRLWPELSAILDSRYTLRTQWSPTRTERWWSREEYPASYRIYTLRAAP